MAFPFVVHRKHVHVWPMEIVSDNEFQLATIQRNMNCFYKMLMQTVLDKRGGGGAKSCKNVMCTLPNTTTKYFMV